MNRTEHYNLHLPGQDDFYDVDVFNDNTRLIDGVLHGLDREARNKELAVTMMASATFRPADHGLAGALVDVYLVGGGAGGRMAMAGGSGGGGGHCRMVRNLRLTEESYSIAIGAGGIGSSGSVVATEGGATRAFGITANGGLAGGGHFPAGQGRGGDGGSGGGGEGGGSAGGFGGGPGNGTSTARGGHGAGNVDFVPFNPYDGVFYGCGGGGTFGIGGGAGGNAAVAAAPTEAATAGRLGGGGGGGGGSGTDALSGGNGGRGGGGGGAGGSNGTLAPAGAGGPGIVYIYAVPERAVGAGALGETEVICDEAVCYVNVGVLQAGVCVDAAVFRDAETAEACLEDGVWPEADAVVVLPEGYGIGDSFDGETWVRREDGA
ncbi:MAG: hypothetical protein FWE28_09140 [Oscillospiraceae bacterium]|nr:hypothetical protein [Oscillospiraceae bacterium]